MAFWMSLTVIRPRSSNSSLTTSTFSIRCWCSRRMASSLLAPSVTVTSFCLRRHGLRDRLIEAGLEAQIAAGDDADQLLPCRPPARRRYSWLRVSSITSRIVASGETVIGSLITPLSYFLTALTSCACRRRSCSCG